MGNLQNILDKKISLALHIPINSLGYGIFSLYFLFNFLKDYEISQEQINNQIDIVPIGSIDLDTLSSFESGNNLIVRNKIVDAKYTGLKTYSHVIYIWHPNMLTSGLPVKLNQKSIGITFFERDRLMPDEALELSKVDKIIPTSQWASQVLNSYGISTTKPYLPYLYYGPRYSEEGKGLLSFSPDIEEFNNFIRRLPGGDNVSFSAGKWEIRKNQHAILDVCSSLAKPNVLIGLWDNPFTGGLIQPINHLNENGWSLKNTYKFFSNIGYVYTKGSCNLVLLPRIPSYEKSLKILKVCDSYASFSSAEGLNLHALEAMYYGLHSIYLTNNTAHMDLISQMGIKKEGIIECIQTPAIDNIWFKGEGNWYKISDKEIERLKSKNSLNDITLDSKSFSSYIHKRKQNGLTNYLSEFLQ
jgi:hypothetical protein